MLSEGLQRANKSLAYFGTTPSNSVVRYRAGGGLVLKTGGKARNAADFQHVRLTRRERNSETKSTGCPYVDRPQNRSFLPTDTAVEPKIKDIRSAAILLANC